MSTITPENKKAAIAYLQTQYNELAPGYKNGDYLKERLEAMSDADFEKYVEEVEKGEEIIPLTVPVLAQHVWTKDNLLERADKLGFNFYSRLTIEDAATGVTYTTPQTYLLLKLPCRRQRQMLRKKITIPDGVSRVDELSGQVTGPSKGSRISMPEFQVLYSQGLDNTTVELTKFRGGDVKGLQLLYRSLAETGRSSMESLMRFNTRVKSTDTLSVVLKSMMLKSPV